MKTQILNKIIFRTLYFYPLIKPEDSEARSPPLLRDLKGSTNEPPYIPIVIIFNCNQVQNFVHSDFLMMVGEDQQNVFEYSLIQGVNNYNRPF